MQRRIWICLTAALALLGGNVAWGQANANSRDDKLRQATRGRSPMLWDVSLVLEGYVTQMTRHYKLTDKQAEYTRALLTSRVKSFLKDYEKDVRSLFGEYWDYQMRGQLPTPEVAKEFAARAAPLVAAMRQEIFDGNQQWRRILDDDQLAQHDRDLETMTRQFDYFEKSLERWERGIVQPSDLGLRGQKSTRRTIRSEDSMEYYVRNFIVQYGLDKGQQETAYSILREVREEAKRYREAHKEELAQLDAAEAELYRSNPSIEADPDDKEARKREADQIQERRARLEQPINVGLFNRLKKQLEDIPTADQRASYRERMDRLQARINQRRAANSRPAEAGTQPAGEASAATP